MAAFLDSVQNLCKRSRNDWYRVYLIRKICSLCGVEYIQKLLHEEQLSWLFPQEVLQMVGFNFISFSLGGVHQINFKLKSVRWVLFFVCLVVVF